MQPPKITSMHILHYPEETEVSPEVSAANKGPPGAFPG